MAQEAAPLTPRQREILRRLAEGEGTHEIASTLGLGAGTVRRHLRSALDKLGGARQAPPSAAKPVGLASRGVRSATPLPAARPKTPHGNNERTLARQVTQAVRTHGALALLALVDTGVMPLPFEPVTALVSPVPATEALEQAVMGRSGLSLRREDSVVTWRDDLVVVVLPGSDLHGAEAVAQRLRGDLRTSRYAIGAVQWRPGERPVSLVARAERVASFDQLQRQAERSLARATRRR